MTKSHAEWIKDAQKPKNWFSSAKTIMAAMDELKPAMRDYWISMKEWAEGDSKAMPSVEYNSVYLMLSALVIENLCKGQIALQLTEVEKRVLDNGKWPRRLMGNHKIEAFFKDVGFTPTAQDREIVSRIQTAIDWRGRYPLPKNPRELLQFLGNSGCDDLLAERLIKRLFKHVVANVELSNTTTHPSVSELDSNGGT